MSNFVCKHCGAECIDSDRGYISGCEHYPDYRRLPRGFGFNFDIATGQTRKWAVGADGIKRWADDGTLCR